MRKTLAPLLFFSLINASITLAQNITISGSVKNEAGSPLPLATVEIAASKNGVKVNETGEFAINASPKAKLLVTCPGYEDKEVSAKTTKNLLVVLDAKEGTDLTEQPASSTTGSQFSNHFSQREGAANSIIYGNSGAGINSLLPVFTHTEETKGSRYLFDGWASGTVLSSKDSVIKNPNYHFNYDKISGALLLSQDMRNAIEINEDQVKAFSLIKDNKRPLNFEFVPEIDKTHYLQVLSTGPKYKIYKQLNTKFIKNNFRTDGMTSSGNNFDEFADESEYYIVDVKTHQIRKTDLKRKAIKDAFKADADKVGTYYDTFSGDISEVYLGNLGDYLNTNKM